MRFPPIILLLSLLSAFPPLATDMYLPALPQLQQELVAVISKYVSIRPEDIKVNLDRQENYEVLEVKIELPEGVVR